eukprot:TRINITY_DN92474_c0_g1_i1.p2 TRINITY_DN92474_c0_g1~~TRINITY_DN92474_c0_g1_i1.p2  ORF type:complete len:140 (+),score=34.77 TRINITY_DN92474_c0_g1_i1:91-510(+)
MAAFDAQSLPFVGERPDKRMQVTGMGDTRAGIEGARHPVEKLLLNAGRRAEQQEMMTMALVHGAHAPIRHKIEREMLSQFQRLPGLTSSLAGLESVLGADESLHFENLFNLEDNSVASRTTGPNWGLHDVMETRLNMKF